MTTNGIIIADGSWNLQIYVSDLQVDRTLRVKGDLHIGGVMLRLVEDLGESYTPVSTRLYVGTSAVSVTRNHMVSTSQPSVTTLMVPCLETS